MIVLADNDVLFKLAQCDLFDEFLGAFGVTTDGIRILKLARFSIVSKKHRKRIGEESFARLSTFLAAVGDITDEPDPHQIAIMTEYPGIDAGEAALFVLCPLIAEAVIVTGDKKSLTGLTEAGETDALCATLCQTLAGRLYCFEQVLIRILDHYGFEAIRERLVKGRECDRGLALWLGSGLDANETSFRDGLTSFLNEVRHASGNLLAE